MAAILNAASPLERSLEEIIEEKRAEKAAQGAGVREERRRWARVRGRKAELAVWFVRFLFFPLGGWAFNLPTEVVKLVAAYGPQAMVEGDEEAGTAGYCLGVWARAEYTFLWPALSFGDLLWLVTSREMTDHVNALGVGVDLLADIHRDALGLANKISRSMERLRSETPPHGSPGWRVLRASRREMRERLEYFGGLIAVLDILPW